MRAEKPAVLSLNCCRLIALLRILAIMLPTLSVFAFAIARFLWFDLNLLFFPVILFSLLLAISLLHTKIILKYFSLKQSKTRYFAFLSFQAICTTGVFSFIVFLIELLPTLNIATFIVMFVFLLIVIVGFIYFFTSLFLRFSYKLFNKMISREDLAKEYAKCMKGLGVKANFFQIKNGFFELPTAMTVLSSNEIILVGPIEKILTGKELNSVIVHELAHLKKKKSILSRAVIVLCLMMAFFIFISPFTYVFLLRAFNKIAAFLILQMLFLLIFIIFIFILFRLKRTGEVEADELAKKTFGTEVYASALKKILKANKIPEGVGSKYLLTHPSLKERLSARKDNSLLYWKISALIGAIVLACNSIELPNLVHYREFPFFVFIYIISIIALAGYLLKKKFSYYLYLAGLAAAILFNAQNILGTAAFLFSEFEEYRFWPEIFAGFMFLLAIEAFNLCRIWLVYKSRKVLGIKGSLK